MNAHTLAPPRAPAATLLAALVAREPTLARFGLLMLLLAVPAAVALGVDARTLRDVNVWVKPIKFMTSMGLFALTTAWFVGLLPEARRRSRAVRAIVATIVATGTFEIGYITLQAALGEASHYNVGDALHGILYTLMGAAAMAMTATQPVLAWQIARHGTMPRGGALRAAVIAGLVLTFVLGAGAGALLGGLQPPAGAGLPLVGWHPSGDLRPAHFVGLHAHQLLPLAGWALDAIAPRRARGALALVVVGYVATWAVLMATGLDGATPAPGYGG